MAVRFDLGRLATQGTPFPVLENVLVDPVQGTAAFAVAGNGTLAYLETGPVDRYVRWLDEDGVELPAIDSAGRYAEAVPSPDGRQLSVILDGDVWTFDLGRSFFTRITRTEQFESRLEWTPDSREVIYQRDVPQFDIFMRAADASTPEVLVLHSMWDKRPGSVSPDGGFLLFSELANTLNDLKIIGFPVMAGDTAVTVAGGPGNQWPGKFSPDGRWIAYPSDESGRSEVYLIPFPIDLGPTRKRVSLDGGNDPEWAPDGRSIYYEWSRRLFRAPVNPSDGNVGRAEELPPIEGLISWDVGPDGRLLIVKTLEGSEQRAVNLVLNWDPELDER